MYSRLVWCCGRCLPARFLTRILSNVPSCGELATTRSNYQVNIEEVLYKRVHYKNALYCNTFIYFEFRLVPQSVPEGIAILLKQTWSNKPRNRPSFNQILKHLSIAASREILLKSDDNYLKMQKVWKEEIMIGLEQLEIRGTHLSEEDIIQKREEDLKHAEDVRDFFEMKLEEANNTYLGLIAFALILDHRERMLVEREKVLNIQNKRVVPSILYNQFLESIPRKNAKKIGLIHKC